MKYILIQGPIELKGNLNQFVRYLKKILNISNEIKIVVSTWETSFENKETLRTQFPEVVFMYNTDPGSLIKKIGNIDVACNINRLISSTFSGLQFIPDDAVVLKIRTDSYLSHDRAFSVYQNLVDFYSDRDNGYTIFSQWIICISQFVRNPLSHMPFLYHPSDICLIGICRDLKMLFGVNLATTDILEPCGGIRVKTNYVLTPEQYIFKNCVEIYRNKEQKKVTFEKNFVDVKNKVDESNQFLINNFIFQTSRAMGFVWPKYGKKYFYKGWSSSFDFNDWKYLQNKYNKTNYKINMGLIYFKSYVIYLSKVYYILRNILLKNKYIHKVAYKLFANR